MGVPIENNNDENALISGFDYFLIRFKMLKDIKENISTILIIRQIERGQ